jgi:hypothetical protein
MLCVSCSHRRSVAWHAWQQTDEGRAAVAAALAAGVPLASLRRDFNARWNEGCGPAPAGGQSLAGPESATATPATATSATEAESTQAELAQ